MAACQRILLEVVVFVLVCSFSAASDQRGFERAALLRFKSSVSDPSGLLQSWSSAVGDHCSWSFVSCDARSRVISLNISGFCSKLGPFDAICTDPSRRLSGSLTPAIGGLSELTFLSLPFHGFYGEIPTEIWRLERLEVIDLSENLLNGTLPRQFSPNLRVINLSGNSMEGEIPVSISSCTSLEALDLSRNRFNGSIPRFLANFSELKEIKLGYNHFQKSIPEEIGINCMNLEYLDLSGNQLCGNIPPNLGNCTEFRVLLLFSNSLDGSIPSELGKLKNLQVLDLSRNNLSGFIPAQLGNCLNLSVLVISNPFDPLIQNKGSDGEFNAFEGGIPENITTLPKLRVLWAPRARIEGEIPNNWGKCENLEMVNLGENMLTGDLQSYFERCNNLKFLNLSSNRLTGRVYGNLPLSSTSDFDTSENQPRFDDLANGYYSFFAYKSREKLNSNKLSKTTPKNLRRFLSSPSDTTDSVSQVTPPSSSNGGGFSSIEIASITSASAIVSVLLALVLLYIYTRKCNPRPSSSEPSRRSSRTRQEVTRFVDLGVPITYESVVRSTGNFNASNCIGSGGFGATYKAEISPGILVAIKRLSVGRVQGIEQFQAEIKTLGRCKHPNLVTLIGYHLGDSEMFLIYNYLPGGNLEKFIQERSKKPVNWRMLHKIALDIAQALAFLHDNCIPRILHRDVKPSNILLDNEYNAYLSDFGLARLLGNSETHATTGVAGTFGYVAPEYAMTCRVSDKADVYSYGVVLLELISDKKALDPSFSPYGNGFNIVGWASMLLNKGRAKEFFFEGLWENAPHDDLVEVLHLGIKCTGDNLSTRPSMKHVVRRLKELRPPNF